LWTAGFKVVAMTFWMKLVLASLATWRVTHLLVSEDGPAQIVVRIRKWFGAGWIGQLMDCFQCLSLWVAAAMAFFVIRQPVELLFTWLAVSGAACLLERIGNEPVVIQHISEEDEGDDDHGMLRSEPDFKEHSFTNQGISKRAAGE
jgi:hypothetical protein